MGLMQETAMETEDDRGPHLTLDVLSHLVQSYQTSTVKQSVDARDDCNMSSEKDVYLSGMSGRFPGAENLKELMKQLQEEKPGKSKKKSQRWPEALFNKAMSYRCLDHAACFDAAFWGMTDDQVCSSTPLLRHLSEVIYEVILDSGLTLEDIKSSQMKTGVYLAISSDLDGLVTSQKSVSAFTTTSSKMAVVIGGLLQTKGPALCLDDEANSSLVAVHTAVSDLRRGVVHFAIVAGGNLLLNPHTTMATEQEKLRLHRNFIQSDGIDAILLARNQNLCPRIYATVKSTSVSCYTQQDENKWHTWETNGMCQTEVNTGKTVICVSDLDTKNSQQPEVCSHCGPAEGLAMMIRAILKVQIACTSPQHVQSFGDSEQLRAGCSLLIQTHGLGGGRGEVLLVPYFASTDTTNSSLSQQVSGKLVLLPLGLDQAWGLDLVCDALTESRCSADMVELLSRSLVVRDWYHPVQAFILLSVDNGIVSKLVQPAGIPREDQAVMVMFGDIFTNSLAYDTVLLTIPAFAESIRQSFQVLTKLQKVDKEYEDIMVTSDYSFILLGCIIQMALVDTLKACLPGDVKMVGVGLGTLMSAYSDGCLTRRQCVQVACCITKLVLDWAGNHGSEYTTLLVRMPCDEVYTLGPKVQVLAVYTETLSLITFRNASNPSSLERASSTAECNDAVYLHHITDMVKRKGGAYRVIPSAPFYNYHYSASFCQELLPRIRSIIPRPVMWSQGLWPAYVTCSQSLQNVADAKLTAESLVQLLFLPVNQPAIIRLALYEPGFVLLAHLPCCDDLDLEGVDLQGGSDLQGDLASCRLLELKTEAVDLLAVLGKLHVMGFTIRTTGLNEDISQVPADCTTLPLSPLITWDHSRNWPLPSWTEFFCKEKEGMVPLYKFPVHQKAIEQGSFSGDLLYHACNGVMSHLKVEKHAVHLSDLVLHCNLASLWDVSQLFLQTSTGRHRFQIYHEDRLVVSGYFSKVEEDPSLPKEPVMDKEPAASPILSKPVINQAQQRENGTGCQWLGFRSLYLFQTAMAFLQDALNQLFPLEMTIQPQHHLEAIKESCVELDVESYTGVCTVGGLTFKFLPFPEVTNDSLSNESFGSFTVHMDRVLSWRPQGVEASQCDNAQNEQSDNNNLMPRQSEAVGQWIQHMALGMEEVKFNASDNWMQKKVVTLKDSIKDSSTNKVRDITQKVQLDLENQSKREPWANNIQQKEGIIKGQLKLLQRSSHSVDNMQSRTDIKQKEELLTKDVSKDLDSKPGNLDNAGSLSDNILQEEVISKGLLQVENAIDSTQHSTGLTSEQKENALEVIGPHCLPGNLVCKDADRGEAADINECSMEKGSSDRETLSDSQMTSGSFGDSFSLLDSVPNTTNVSKEDSDPGRQGRCQLDTAVMEKMSLGRSLQSMDTVEVVLAEVVNICGDIITLLYLGTDCIKACKVAGLWCSEYEDVTLQVPVPDSWTVPHALMLLYSLTAAYIMEEARNSVHAGRTVVLHPPFDALSLSVMLSLHGSGEGFEVIALTDDLSDNFIQSLCPYIQRCQPCSVLAPFGGPLATHFCWADGDISVINQLNTSSHLIQCGRPPSCTQVLPARLANMTLTFVDPQRAVRDTLSWLKRGDASGDRIVNHLANHLPEATQSQQILLLDTPAALGHGFERLETHRFHGKITLNALVYALQSPTTCLSSLLPDTFEDDLEFLALMNGLLFNPPEAQDQRTSMQQSRALGHPDFVSIQTLNSSVTRVSDFIQTDEGSNYYQTEDGIDEKSTEGDVSSLSGHVKVYEPLRIVLWASVGRKVELVKENASQILPVTGPSEHSRIMQAKKKTRQTREEWTQTGTEWTKGTEQWTQTKELKSSIAEANDSAQGDDSVIMQYSFSDPLASGTPHDFHDSGDSFRSALSACHGKDRFIILDSTQDYTDRHPSDSAARCSPWEAGPPQSEGHFAQYSSPTPHPVESDILFMTPNTPNSLILRHSESDTFISATPTSPLSKHSISDTEALPIAPLSTGQFQENAACSFLSYLSTTANQSHRDHLQTADSDETRVATPMPSVPCVGPTYWDSCPSDSEMQERRYFDAVEDPDSSSSEEERGSVNVQSKTDTVHGLKQQGGLMSGSAPETEKRLPVLRSEVLCKSFLGLDVSNSSTSTQSDVAEASSELSPISLQSQQQLVSPLSAPQQLTSSPAHSREPEQRWKQAILLPLYLLSKQARGDSLRDLEPVEEEGRQPLTSTESSKHKPHQPATKKDLGSWGHKAQGLHIDPFVKPTSYFVTAPSWNSRRNINTMDKADGKAGSEVKERASLQQQAERGREEQSADIGWHVDRRCEAVSLGDAFLGGKLKTHAGPARISEEDETMKEIAATTVMLPKIEKLRSRVNPEEEYHDLCDLSLEPSHSDNSVESTKSYSSIEIEDGMCHGPHTSCNSPGTIKNEIDKYFASSGLPTSAFPEVLYPFGNADSMEKPLAKDKDLGGPDDSPAAIQHQLLDETLDKGDQYLSARVLSETSNTSGCTETAQPMNGTKSEEKACCSSDSAAETKEHLLREILEEVDECVASGYQSDPSQSSADTDRAEPMSKAATQHHLSAERFSEGARHTAAKDLFSGNTDNTSPMKKTKKKGKCHGSYKIGPAVRRQDVLAETLDAADRSPADLDVCSEKGLGLVLDVNSGKMLMSSVSQGSQSQIVTDKVDSSRVMTPQSHPLPSNFPLDSVQNVYLSTPALSKGLALAKAEKENPHKEHLEHVEVSLSVRNICSHTKPLNPSSKLDTNRQVSSKLMTTNVEEVKLSAQGTDKDQQQAEQTGGHIEKYNCLMETVYPDELLPYMPGEVLPLELVREIEDAMNADFEARDSATKEQTPEMFCAGEDQVNNKRDDRGTQTKKSEKNNVQKEMTECGEESNKEKKKPEDKRESNREKERKGNGEGNKKEGNGGWQGGDEKGDDGEGNRENSGNKESGESCSSIDPAFVRTYVAVVIRMAQLKCMSMTEGAQHQPSLSSEGNDFVFVEYEHLTHTPEEDLGSEIPAVSPANAQSHGGDDGSLEQSRDSRPENLEAGDKLGEEGSEDKDKLSLKGSCSFDTPEKPRFSFSLEQSSLFDLSLDSLNTSVMMDKYNTKERGSMSSDVYLMTSPGSLRVESRTHAEPLGARDACCETLPQIDDSDLVAKTPPTVTMEMLPTSQVGGMNILQDSSLDGGSIELRLEYSPALAPVVVDSLAPPQHNASYSADTMSTPVHNSGHEAPLVMPKTPVPCIRRRQTIAGTCAGVAAEAAGFGSRPYLLKSHSYQDRPPLLRSVTSLTSPVLRAKLKMSPLFEVPRRKSGSSLTMSSQCSVVRRLSLFSKEQGLNQSGREAKGLFSREKCFSSVDGVGLKQTYNIEESLSSGEKHLNQPEGVGLDQTYIIEENSAGKEKGLNQLDLNQSDALSCGGFSKSSNTPNLSQQEKDVNQSAHFADFIPSCTESGADALDSPPFPGEKGQDQFLQFKTKYIALSKGFKRKDVADYSCKRPVQTALDLTSDLTSSSVAVNSVQEASLQGDTNELRVSSSQAGAAKPGLGVTVSDQFLEETERVHTNMKDKVIDNTEMKDDTEVKDHAEMKDDTEVKATETEHTDMFRKGMRLNQSTFEAASGDATRQQARKLSTLFPEWMPESCEQDEDEQGKHLMTRRVSVVRMTGHKLSAYAPGIQGLLEPSVVRAVLEPLASMKRKSALVRPLYIVHPITGSVEMLKELAQGLDIVCIGIQKTESAIDFSVETLARFYCQAITQCDRRGTYRLAGYSYGGMLVFEMACQLQREGKHVELLLFLDGSPMYVHCQTQYPRRHLPPDASPEHAAALVETHFLLHIISMYKALEQRALVAAMLQQLDSREKRVEAAIGVTMGTVQVSSSMAQGHWLGLKAKVEEAKQGQRRLSIDNVVEDIISLKRQQKAKQMLHAAAIADLYDPSEGERFQGNVHLIRIKTTPAYCCPLPADYGLGSLCTGTVKTCYVEGGHESMMQAPHVRSVVTAIKDILNASSASETT